MVLEASNRKPVKCKILKVYGHSNMKKVSECWIVIVCHGEVSI